MMKYFSIILLILLFSCTESANVTECVNPLVDEQAEVMVNRVIDGDTFTILVKDDEFSVRILGIDCFESRRGERLEEQAAKKGISADSAYSLGQLAKKFADSLLTGKRIWIYRDPDEDNFDNYSRMLRHVKINGRRYDSIMVAMGFTV